MSTYLRWNDALVAHFFRPDMAGRPVYLHVTENVISEVGERLGGGLAEFIAAVKEGPPWATREGLCQRALQAFHDWRPRGLAHPPYVAYLALFVLAAGVEGEFAQQAYYPRLRWLLEDPDLDAGTLPSFERMLDLWDDLEVWSARDANGELGIFTARIAGGKIHIGLPIGQTILTDSERRWLPHIFSEAGLDPTSAPPDSELARVLRTHGTGRLRHRTLDLLAERHDEELYTVLLGAAADELAEWDGSVGEADPASTAAPRAYATARLCLRLDTVAGRARVTVRCRVHSEFPEDRLILVSPALPAPVWCDEFIPGWSSQLADLETGQPIDGSRLAWADGTVLTEANPSGAWQVKLPGRSVRPLVEGSAEGLPGLVETYQLPSSQSFYLLFSEGSWPELSRWLQEECLGFAEYAPVEGLPPGWRLAAVERAVSDRQVRNRFPWLAFSERLRIRLQGGIRQSRGDTFFAFAPPELVLEGGDGKEEVACQGRTLAPSEDRHYKLPHGMPVDTRISIEVRREGQVVARRSLYIMADFAWRSASGHVFDRWGRPAQEVPRGPVAIAGAAVSDADLRPGHFSMPVLLTPGLDGTFGRVFFVGRAPGQVVRWPMEAIPDEWQPIWAIPLARRGKALYCGTAVEECAPLHEPWGDPKGVSIWKDVLWHRRKRITPPDRPVLRGLWKEYMEAARLV
jgi:hypothetical protein